MKKPVIEFCNFGFRYQEQSEPTLFHINLTVREGEKILLAGPSGSGKSTLANCINGLIPFAHKGEITGSLKVLGTETREQSVFELSKAVGTVLQDPDGQFIGLKVGEDIAFALENDCVPRGELHRRVKEAADTVGVGDLLENSPQELSGGQKQRVSIAGVLVDDIDILLFDEPLANLDPAAGKRTIDLIDRLNRERNKTVLIVEHRLEDVLFRDVDRIVLLNDGRIAADLPPDELLATGLLGRCGIREPLYLTALRYAGCMITAREKPAHVESVSLREGAPKLREWLRAAPPEPPAQKSEPLFEAEHLTFCYDNGVTALQDVSFAVSKGEMVAVVGRNGAGKSTLAKLICGFEKPGAGRIVLNGADITGQNIRKRAEHIGYVMQNPNQMISKNMIYDEVALGLRARGVPENEAAERVELALAVCGLREYRKWPISALSFGQKKRVTIASVLVSDPEIIILDEPTAGQDFRHYTEIMEFLLSLNRRGTTVLMITHDMHLMLEYTPRAVVFSQGRILKDGSAASVLTDPELAGRASLKVTSLYTLAERCGIPDRMSFVRYFIRYDRQVRKG